jgi:ATP synthase protein I
MPQPEDPREEALRRLDKDLDAFDAKRKAQASPLGDARAASDGYRMLAGLIGGLLGGLGLGWTFDHFVHTSPWGLISGLLLGLGVSTYAAIRSASQMSARAVEKYGTAPPAPDDDGDE